MGLGGIISGAASAARKVAGTVQKAATEGAQKAVQGAQKAAQGVQKASSAAVNHARDTFEDTKKVASNVANKANQVAEAGANKVLSATDKAADVVQRATPKPIKTAANKAADLHNRVSNAIDSKLSSGAKKALDVAGRAAGAVGAGLDAVTGNPKALLTGPATVAGELANKAGPVGKAAARFVPGANVAAAAWDAHNFVKTLNDPKANGTDKALAGATALGSALGATNIPVVSQVGSVVATGADILNSFFGSQK